MKMIRDGDFALLCRDGQPDCLIGTLDNVESLYSVLDDDAMLVAAMSWLPIDAPLEEVLGSCLLNRKLRLALLDLAGRMIDEMSPAGFSGDCERWSTVEPYPWIAVRNGAPIASTR